MSEEEIISSINALILYASCQKDSGEKYKKVAVDNIDIQALNGILDLYNKEKEKNKDIERYKRIASQKLDDIEEFRKNECNHRCIKNAEVQELKEYYQENYISKDKIRELKKSLQEQIAETRELFFDKNTISEIIYENEIKLLQELLEE